MASASVYPDDVLLTTPGKSSFTRLTRLLICGGTKVLRELFDSMNSSTHAFLKTKTVNRGLHQMKKKRVLTRPQWKTLFPTKTTCGKSTDFDITLLFKLLREFCSLTAPPKGWDELPDDIDLTLPADLARIKYYRNDVYAHVNDKMELNDTDFQDLWIRIKDALVRIVKHYDPSAVLGWEEAIEELLTDPLSEEAQEYEEELEEWYMQDQDVKKMISNTCTKDDMKEGFRALEARIERKNYPPSSPVNVRCVWKLATVLGWVGGSSYLIYHYKDDPEKLIRMMTRVALPMGVVVTAIVAGSTILQIQAESVDALDELWRRYKSGQLEQDLQEVFLIDEVVRQAKGKDIGISVGIKEENFHNARRELLRADQRAKEGKKLPEEFGTKMRIEQKSFQFEILDGDIVEDGENRVQAHLAVITSKDQVEQVLAELKKKDPDVAKAKHNIWAYRIFNTGRNAYDENCDDDGDYSSGARVLRFLQRAQATDVMVVVSCWYETTAEDFWDGRLGRLKCIQKSVLDLFLTYGIMIIPSARIKTFYEEIKYTRFEKAKEQETPKFDILHGETIEDRKSTFQAHLADITSREQVVQVLEELKKDRKIAKATYNMWACRIYDERKKSYFEEGNDDGENLGGKRLLHLLQRSDAKNVVIIVTRWHGGIHLGNDRFKHINKCAADLLQSMGKIKAKDCGVPKSRVATPKIRRKSKAY